MNNAYEKVTLITGGAIRIGKIIAEELPFTKLVLHYHSSKQDALALQQKLLKKGCQVELFQADFLKPKEIENLFLFIKEKYGKLDILINNAACFQKTDFLNESDFDSIFNLNLKAPLLCMQKAAQLMPEGSSIINIGDKSAKTPFDGFALHSISKAALMHATIALALELAPKIRVNNLLLGLALSSPHEGSQKDKRLIQKHVLLKRLPKNSEIANAIEMILNNHYLNATTIELDGGWV